MDMALFTHEEKKTLMCQCSLRMTKDRGMIYCEPFELSNSHNSLIQKGLVKTMGYDEKYGMLTPYGHECRARIREGNQMCLDLACR
jgi:hypothetical protein